MNKSVRKPPLKTAEKVIRVMCELHNGLWDHKDAAWAIEVLAEFPVFARHVAGLVAKGQLYSDKFPPREIDDERVDIAGMTAEIRRSWSEEDYHKRSHHYARGELLIEIGSGDYARMNAYRIPMGVDSSTLRGDRKMCEEVQLCDNDYWGINYEYKEK